MQTDHELCSQGCGLRGRRGVRPLQQTPRTPGPVRHSEIKLTPSCASPSAADGCRVPAETSRHRCDNQLLYHTSAKMCHVHDAIGARGEPQAEAVSLPIVAARQQSRETLLWLATAHVPPLQQRRGIRGAAMLSCIPSAATLYGLSVVTDFQRQTPAVGR